MGTSLRPNLSWVLLSSFLFSACGEDSLFYAHEPPATYLNDRPGFVVKHSGKKSLIAAIRKDDKELRIETLWRPSRFSLLKSSSWCSRVVDQDNHLTAISCVNLPKQWQHTQLAGTSKSARKQARTKASLGRQMYEAMTEMRPPPGREEAWKQLLTTAKGLMNSTYPPLGSERPRLVFREQNQPAKNSYDKSFKSKRAAHDCASQEQEGDCPWQPEKNI